MGDGDHRGGAAPRRDAERPTGGEEQWIDHGPSGGSRPSRRPARPPQRSAPATVASVELSGVGGLSVAERRRLGRKVTEAAEHYANERWDDARLTLAPLADRYAGIPEIRELHGLALYRLGRWAPAIAELEAFGELTGAADQLPVIADSHRALGDHERVAEVWEELRDWSPDGDVVTEGRIVAAGSLADQGDLRGALRLLEKGPTRPKRVKASTLRLWYAIGDLQERAGDVPAARATFERLASAEADFGDVAERLAALG